MADKRFHVGGEAHCTPDSVHSLITDSGRSSIRLILKSGFRAKRFLLPDFLCGVIPRLFEEAGAKYSFYRVRPDLSADLENFDTSDFDALYLIRFFGKSVRYPAEFAGESRLILEDCVFLPALPEPPQGIRNWIGFNSLRKITPLADGSIIRSTVELDRKRISRSEAPFQSLKYRAKEWKAEYLSGAGRSEGEFLSLFREGEAAIDSQRRIYRMSDRSLMLMLDLYRNLERDAGLRTGNYRTLDLQLAPWKLELDTAFPTFYLLSVKNRERLKKRLAEENVFLPSHWPNEVSSDNPLYQMLLPVPVDPRYCATEMEQVALLIRKFLEEDGKRGNA